MRHIVPHNGSEHNSLFFEPDSAFRSIPFVASSLTAVGRSLSWFEGKKEAKIRKN